MIVSFSLAGCTSGAPPQTPSTSNANAGTEAPLAAAAPADLHVGPWIIDRYEAAHLEGDAAQVALSLTSTGRFWITGNEIWVADESSRHIFARLAWEGPDRAKVHRGETGGLLVRESPRELALETDAGVLALHLVPFETAKVVQPLCLLSEPSGKPGYVVRKEACAAPERAFDPL
ncbi:MAG: hypothetical protein HOV80_07025 [Polyangiaceae bacterium]|nr:hypothetical protein [Polyangiaceae bacterium]